uniref:DUF2283 domain-containing protein n=1 Tax=Candidatus Kentrum sp. DK TaxID=2126562 RepID=A0A450RTT8_9GAMM|nr:MAG: Protein of unknown function (DUF2283) [Candidatus Kentron sp. DK]
MKQAYLEVTFRRGRPLAAYLYLPRGKGDKSVRTEKAEPGMVIDFESGGRAIGIEMTAPNRVTAFHLNRLLTELGASPITGEDLAPLEAA